MRAILLLACVAMSAHGAAISSSFNQPPAFVPEDRTPFFLDLSDKDMNALDDIFANLTQSVEQVREVVEANREEFYRSSDAFNSYILEKVSSLRPKAKEFANLVLKKLRDISPKKDHKKPTRAEIRDNVNEVIEAYKALSDADKENLKTTFPKVTNLVNDAKFQQVVEELLETAGRL